MFHKDGTEPDGGGHQYIMPFSTKELLEMGMLGDENAEAKAYKGGQA